ncbi:MAG: hypothetical protein SNJ78_08755 [Spirochaetales bacterium]
MKNHIKNLPKSSLSGFKNKIVFFACVLGINLFLFPYPGFSQEPVISGQIRAGSRLYIQKDAWSESTWHTLPRLDLSMEAKSNHAEAKLKLRLEDTWAQSLPNTPFNRVVDEAYLRSFFGDTVLDAGYFKLVWGKGDDIHVLDVLNPTNYYDFVNNDYLDRRSSEWMIRLLQPLGSMHAVEFVWQPVTNTDTIPFTGPWKPYEISKLEAMLGQSALQLQENGKITQQTLNSLTDGTYGVRFTGSAGGFDYGLLYAYTFHRQPKVELKGSLLNPPTLEIHLSYDRIHVFGIEGSTAFQGFTFRMEGGYFLTPDTKGTDPKVRNNWVGYVGGFDRDLWTDGPNLNLQIQGTLPLQTDKIDKNNMADLEFRSNGKYTIHIVAGNLSYTFAENKLKTKVSAAYGLEQKDLRLAPELTYEPFDDFQCKIRWVQFIGNSDTPFGQYKDSSFFELGVSYRF